MAVKEPQPGGVISGAAGAFAEVEAEVVIGQRRDPFGDRHQPAGARVGVDLQGLLDQDAAPGERATM